MRETRLDENESSCLFDTIDRYGDFIDRKEEEEEKERQPLNSKKKIFFCLPSFSTALKRNVIHKTVEIDRNYVHLSGEIAFLTDRRVQILHVSGQSRWFLPEHVEEFREDVLRIAIAEHRAFTRIGTGAQDRRFGIVRIETSVR